MITNLEANHAELKHFMSSEQILETYNPQKTMQYLPQLGAFSENVGRNLHGTIQQNETKLLHSSE